MTAADAPRVTSVVSVTRFRMRAIRFLPFFIIHANRTVAQIRKADGFATGTVQREAERIFWTLTVWRDDAAMRAYVASGAHRKAMPHVVNWADEASVGHWEQSGLDLPDWPEAVRRFQREGRPLTLRYPAPQHLERRFADPQMTGGMRL